MDLISDFYRFVDGDMYMQYQGMGIGHQSDAAARADSSDMDCEPDSIEDTIDDGDNIASGGHEESGMEAEDVDDGDLGYDDL